MEEAAREAQRRRAELRVVQALSWPVRPMYAPLDPSPLNRLVSEAAQRARGVAPEVEVTEAVVTGDAVAVLEAESRAADLVVVGPRGTGGFIGMLLGSTAASLDLITAYREKERKKAAKKSKKKGKKRGDEAA